MKKQIVFLFCVFVFPEELCLNLGIQLAEKTIKTLSSHHSEIYGLGGP